MIAETTTIMPNVFYHMFIHYNQVTLNDQNLMRLINVFVTYHSKQKFHSGFVLDFLTSTDTLLKSILWL